MVLDDVVAATLGSRKCRMRCRDSLANVAAVLGRFGPSVVVLSIRVKANSDVSGTSRLGVTTPNAPVLCVSSRARDRRMTETLGSNTMTCLGGPFDMRRLVTCMSERTRPISGTVVGVNSLRLGVRAQAVCRTSGRLGELDGLRFSLLGLLCDRGNRVMDCRGVRRL